VQSDQPWRKSGYLKSLGICLGASTISIVQIELEPEDKGSSVTTILKKPRIIEYSLYPHEGDPKRTLRFAIKDLDLNSFDRIAATGRKFRSFVNLSSIPVLLIYPRSRNPKRLNMPTSL
jgi:hypothetical protein